MKTNGFLSGWFVGGRGRSTDKKRLYMNAPLNLKTNLVTPYERYK